MAQKQDAFFLHKTRERTSEFPEKFSLLKKQWILNFPRFLPLHGSSISECTCGTGLFPLLFPNLHLFLHFITSTIFGPFVNRSFLDLFPRYAHSVLFPIVYSTFFSLFLWQQWFPRTHRHINLSFFLFNSSSSNSIATPYDIAYNLFPYLHHTSILSFLLLLWNLASTEACTSLRGTTPCNSAHRLTDPSGQNPYWYSVSI